MRKSKFKTILLSALFSLTLAGCSDTPPSSSQPPSNASQPSNSDETLSSSQPPLNSSEAPDGYVNRYPGEYNTKLADYDDIHVEDKDGGDISHAAIDLWYAANEIYNVDNWEMFEMDNHEVSLREYAVPQSNELFNYYTVVESVFTQNGITQLEQTLIGYQHFPLIRKKDDKVYRMGSWKTGCDFARALTDMQVKELSEDKITLEVTYAIVDNDDTILDRVNVDFTIANVDGNWLVDDYIYPEVYQE